MRSLVVLLVVCGFTYGILEFKQIYKGDLEIPKNLEMTGELQWELVEKDKVLNIHWYHLVTDPYVQLAFDGLGVLAGARLVIPKEGEKEFYTKSKIFKEESISNKSFYTATVLFTLEGLLKGKGRRTIEDDDIVQLVLVKLKNGSDVRIQRDACDNTNKNKFIEQGCQKNYGLVFTPSKKEDEKCDYPFFLVYDEKLKGNLLGFGWLAPATDIKGSEALTESAIKAFFPSNPACLTGKTAVNIWLAKEASGQATCDVEKGKFVEKRCQTLRRGGMD